MNTLTEEQADKVAEYLNGIIDQQTEYAESHEDAGNDYSHMPRESWVHDQELKQFMADNQIGYRGLDLDQVSDLYLDNFEMVSNHMFSSTDSKVFSPFSYPVGQVEIQIELSTVANELEVTVEQLIDVLVTRFNLREPACDTAELYGNSDMFWTAEMSAYALQELINDTSEV